MKFYLRFIVLTVERADIFSCNSILSFSKAIHMYFAFPQRWIHVHCCQYACALHRKSLPEVTKQNSIFNIVQHYRDQPIIKLNLKKRFQIHFKHSSNMFVCYRVSWVIHISSTVGNSELIACLVCVKVKTGYCSNNLWLGTDDRVYCLACNKNKEIRSTILLWRFKKKGCDGCFINNLTYSLENLIIKSNFVSRQVPKTLWNSNRYTNQKKARKVKPFKTVVPNFFDLATPFENIT